MSTEANPQQSESVPIESHELTNANGLTATVTNYGARWMSMCVPDRAGDLDHVVLGFATAEEFVGPNPHLGSVVGRCANRIDAGKFTLNGKTYTLAKNEGGRNHLHGGNQGFGNVVWESVDQPEKNRMTFHYRSGDGEEGYPGTLDVTVTYTLTDNDAMRIEYRATTDQDTIVNLSNHAYFNLAGSGSGDILGHEMQLPGTQFTPINERLIPTGEVRDVAGTPFDFTDPTPTGARINQGNEQLGYGGGYDHNWVVAGWREGQTEPLKAAEVHEPATGRVLTVYTNQPGVQFYAGNMMDGSAVGREGKPYGYREGFCLETQYFPDAINHPNFAQPILRAGAEYVHTTLYQFSTR